MVEIKLNDISFAVETNISVLEACEYVGFEVPRFCYHQNLSIAGNCRMCLVEIANSPKPVASCALPILNNMKIYVNSPLVKKARENILEALLLKHPLDCPICDQAGECDLQDQSKSFGLDSNRFFFKKRFVEDKTFSPLIKTIMTRCIHCTRCVRFNSEIAVDECLGTLTRGASTEIGSYYNNSSLYLSEMSANVVDLCPVGALTLKNYVFKARPWELKTLESIDLSDGLASSIYISFKETFIVRTFPKANQEINENFISDKARLYYDSQISNRVPPVTPNFNIEKNIRALIPSLKAKFVINNSLDLENLFFINTLKNTNYNMSCSFLNSNFLNKSNFFVNWINNLVYEMESISEVCFIVSSNVNLENSIIANKLRIKSVLNNLTVFGFSLNFPENLNLNFLNLNFEKFFLTLEGKIDSSRFIVDYFNPTLLFSENITKRGVNTQLFSNIIKKVVLSSTFLKIQTSNNEHGLMQFNLRVINSRFLDKADLLFFLELEDSYIFKRYLIDRFQKNVNSPKFISLNSHASSIINSNYQFLLPTEYEEEKVFFNLEGRVQKTSRVFNHYSNQFKSCKELLYNFLGK